MGWYERGACIDSASDLFFDPAYEETAKTLCRGCKVRRECLAHALDRPTEKGIWGGTNDEERRAMRGVTVKIEYNEF